MEASGRKITVLTPTQSFCAGFGAATSIVLATKLGLAISITYTRLGGVLEAGLARGNRGGWPGHRTGMILSWLVTGPAGVLLAVVFFRGLRARF